IHLRNLHSYLEVPLRCNYCDAAFHERHAFRQHKKTHRNEKRFKCDQCSYACKQERHMVMHKWTHTGEKPFVCASCSKHFRQKQLLTVHFKKHHDSSFKPKVYECPKCGKEYSRWSNMHKHADKCEDRRAIHPSKGSKGKKKEDKRSSLHSPQEADLKSACYFISSVHRKCALRGFCSSGARATANSSRSDVKPSERSPNFLPYPKGPNEEEEGSPSFKNERRVVKLLHPETMCCTKGRSSIL
ncbi:hypothetical protein JRQ81_014262, partial [Phrynocephalus forsythii]